MSILLRRITSGPELEVAAVVREKNCPFEETIKAVRASNPRAATKLMAASKIAANHGLEALDPSRFKPLGDGLYEFKEHSAGIRVFCFHDEQRRNLVILHKTWIKAGKDNRQSKEIEKARKEMAALKSIKLLPYETEETRR